MMMFSFRFDHYSSTVADEVQWGAKNGVRWRVKSYKVKMGRQPKLQE